MHRRAFFRRAATLPSSAPVQHLPPRALTPLVIAAGLESHSDPLDERRAAHLLRRSGFGGTPEQIQAFVGQDAATVVDALVDEALNRPLPEPPVWANEPLPPRNASEDEREAFLTANREWGQELNTGWLTALPSGGLRERMTLFWSNHFVTEFEVYSRLATYGYRYLTLLRTHALGDFKAFVYDMGLTPAMLVYLNGTQNRTGAANENYARELLELFTMSPQDAEGQANYTQTDITEIARALTGWVVDGFDLEGRFILRRHDAGEKTIFGQTGTFGYADVIDVIFQERGRQTASFICAKLYQEFVYAVPDPAIVAELADTFMANTFDIASVVRVLLKSAHFFDEQVIGAKIKSPIDMLAGVVNESMTDPPDRVFQQMGRFASFAGQTLLSPPNVAGWPGYHDWLDTSTFPLRWLASDALLQNGRMAPHITLVQIAEQVHDPNSFTAAFELPMRLAEYLMAVPLENVSIPTIAEGFGGDLANNPIPAEILDNPAYALDLTKIFLNGIPWYEWFLYADGASSLLSNYLRFLRQLPEYQLA